MKLKTDQVRKIFAIAQRQVTYLPACNKNLNAYIDIHIVT
jgi:hypothetical protein